MSLLLLALAAAQAASVPIRLPAQERVADWQEALSIAGLAVGVPGEGPWVDVVAGSTTWTVRVRDLAGVIHNAPVKPPTTELEREDLAMLAVSLLQPVALPKPVKVAVPPPPVRTAPRVVPPPVPEPLPPEPDPTPEPPPVVAPPVEPEPVRATFQGRLGIAGEVRPWSAPTGLLWGEVQWVGPSPLRPSFGASVTLPADLPQITDDVAYWSSEVWVGAWYAASVPFRFDFGIAGGVAARSFLKNDEPVGLAWIPVLSTRAEVPIVVTGWLTIEPGVHLQLDAREIDLRSDEDGTTRFGDWSVRAAVAFRLNSGDSPKP